MPGEQVAEFLQLMEQSQEVHQSGDKYYWMSDGYPAQAISLRSASPNTVVLHAQTADGWKVIGEVDSASADWFVHPEAVYMHEGQTYLVEELDLEQHLAYLKPVEVDYYTQPQRQSTVALLHTHDQLEVKGGEKGYNDLLVTTQVVGYNKIEWYTHQRLGQRRAGPAAERAEHHRLLAGTLGCHHWPFARPGICGITTPTSTVPAGPRSKKLCAPAITTPASTAAW